MRTKHILTALAIPALFAACVADDFNEAVTGSDMAQRALLSENFKLNFGGPDTRFSAGEGTGLSFSYEVGDRIGGAIIDEYHPENIAENKSPYVVVPYVSTNHPFVLNEQGEWAIEHTMVEGNYLFYFPYNENNHARTAPMYSIPVMQDMSGKDGKFDPKAAVEKYSMGVGAQFLDKEDLSASLQLVNIFGYLHLNIVLDNHYPDGHVDKIVIESPKTKTGYTEAQKFALNGQLDNEGISTLFETLEDKGATAFEDALEDKVATTDFAITDTKSPYYIEEMNEKSPVIVGKAPEGTALENIGQGNKGFETYLVIPATAEPADENAEVTIYLYTTEGDIYSGTVKLVDFYVTRNKVRSVEVEVEKGEAVPYVVTSEADWNNNVEMLAKDEEATFIIAGDDFTITNNTKYPTNGATITVASDLKVTGNNVTIKNVAASKVIVEKGAKLTTDGTFSATNIENKGTVEFAVVYNKEDKDVIDNYRGVTSVDNEAGATLNILKDAIVTLKLNNKLDDRTAALNHGAVTVNGQATLSGNSENNGDITIAAGGSLRGQFTNTAEVIYPKGAKEEDIEGRYTPTITNNGEIYVTDGTVTNNGKIVNNDEISCSRIGTASFVNGKGGVIELGEKVQMLISDNTNGEIVLNALDQTGWAVDGDGGIGTVSYRTKAADNDKSYDFTKVGKNITKLYVTGDLGVTVYGKLNNVVIENDANLALPETNAEATGTLNALTVEEGVTAAISSEGAVLGTLTVEKDARLTINEDNKVTTGKVYNGGDIYVGGNFATTNMSEKEAKDYAEKNGGTFRNTVGGAKGNISFNEQVPDITDEMLRSAIKGVFTAWYGNSSVIGVDESKKYRNWESVTAATLVSNTDWRKEVNWMKTAIESVETATGETMTGEEFEKYLATPEVAKVLTEAIAEAKTEAIEAFNKAKAEITNETWLGANVYVQATENGAITLKDEVVDEGKTATTVVKGFESYIKTNFLLSYGNNDAKSHGMQLSAGSYVGAEADVPAYSYIRTYKGAEEYDVLAGLNFLIGKTWFTKTGGGAYANTDFNTLEGVKAAMEVVYTKYHATGNDAMTALDKADVEHTNILTYFQNVRYNWAYTKKSIETLNGLFNE